MGLETGTYIDSLVNTNPTFDDPIAQGDDHIRLLKSTILSTFPSITGAVTSTHTELNILDGVTATATELNYVDITTLGTVEASKAVTVDANKDVTGFNDIDISGSIVTGGATALGAEAGSVTISTGDSGVTAVNANADDLIVENNTNCGITVATPNTAIGYLAFSDPEDDDVGMIAYSHSSNTMYFYTNGLEAMRIDSSENLLVGKTALNLDVEGIQIAPGGQTAVTRDGGTVFILNRLTDDGVILSFEQDGATEGNISVSGTTVSYNGGHLSRWSQLTNNTSPTGILRGTVMSGIEEMCEWVDDEGNPEDNEQLTRTKVSDVVSDKNVQGIFDMEDNDDELNDFYLAQSGDFIIRVTGVVNNGDLLESNGDGTARVQADDIVRSSTIAKATFSFPNAAANEVNTVPCYLMLG
jgi:hypothetical protein